MTENLARRYEQLTGREREFTPRESAAIDRALAAPGDDEAADQLDTIYRERAELVDEWLAWHDAVRAATGEQVSPGQLAAAETRLAIIGDAVERLLEGAQDPRARRQLEGQLARVREHRSD